MSNLATPLNTREFKGHHYLDGWVSDPSEQGWMCGSPPPVEKRVTFESDNFLEFPQLRWSLSHMRELLPTVNVWRGRGGVSHFQSQDQAPEIDSLEFIDLDGRERRFDEALYETYTDGIIVMHRGRIVYERYFGALERHLPHACHSVTKSYAGTLAAALVQEGVLDDKKTVGHYLPELRGTAFEDATFRQVMDMRTGVSFTVDYDDPYSGIWQFSRACGWRPRTKDVKGPRTITEYLRTLTKVAEHGEAFAYKIVDTEVMSWVMARVTGRSFAQLLEERIWGPIGCEEDGYLFVDLAGMTVSGAGLSCTLRDLARFGELMRREGEWDGKQVIPATAIHDIRSGGDARSDVSQPREFSYRSQWWLTHNEVDGFEARGLKGQRLHIAPKAEMVVARFASHPIGESSANEPITGPQILALARTLRG